MISDESATRHLLRTRFPDIIEPDLIDDILRESQVLDAPAGATILEVGSTIAVIPLALDGVVKVSRIDENGNELFLYYIQPGETCAMTLSACLHEERSLVRATAEEDCRILAIPAQRMAHWQNLFASWRRFIVLAYESRFHEVMHTIDRIAFQHLDDRLVTLLQTKARVLGTKTLHLSHQNLADELHATREVVSRLLKQLEKQGKLALFRNRIEIISLM